MALTWKKKKKKGKLPLKHTKEELERIKINRRNGRIRRTQRLKAEGRLGNKSKSFTTKGRKWMYNPITKHKIYVKAIDIQHYLDIGYKFGIK